MPLRGSHAGPQITLRGLGEKFDRATDTMRWLAKCAYVIASHGHCVEWVTPLGLPVHQPYRERVGLCAHHFLYQAAAAKEKKSAACCRTCMW